MPAKRISLSEIAAKAGVSTSAVSLALRGSPKVSAKQRARIREIAGELGYTPDPKMAELMHHLRKDRAGRKLASIGVVVPELKTAEWEQFPALKLMMTGIREKAAAMGYGVDLFVLEELQASRGRIRNILRARGIDGVVLLPFKRGVERLGLDLQGMRAVTGGYSIVDLEVHRVVPNYLQMMDEMLEAASSLGYRRIGMIMPYKESGGGTGRKLFLSSYYYYQTLMETESPIPVLRNRDASPEGIRKWIERYRPEAVISSGAALRRIEKIGYKAPRNLGFASIDLSEPPRNVAGVDHRWDQVGRECVDLLVSDIRNGELGPIQDPKLLLVDSHFRPGSSLKRLGEPVPIRIRNRPGG